MIIAEQQTIPLQTDEYGTVRVGKTRVRLDTVIYAFKQGYTPEEIVLHYDALSLPDVYMTIAYYLNHQESVEQYLQQQLEEAEALRREIESKPDYQAFRERILARQRTLAQDRTHVLV